MLTVRMYSQALSGCRVVHWWLPELQHERSILQMHSLKREGERERGEKMTQGKKRQWEQKRKVCWKVYHTVSLQNIASNKTKNKTIPVFFFHTRDKFPTALKQQTLSKQSPLCWGGLHQCGSTLNKQTKHATLTPLTTLGSSDGA